MAEIKVGSIQKIYCNTCKARTNHELKVTHERIAVDTDLLGDVPDEAKEHEIWRYLFWVCRGCDTATLQEEYVSYPGDSLNQRQESFFHPKREKSSLPFKIFERLDPKLNRIYQEVIASFNHDVTFLCAVGLRALLEGICVDKGIEARNLRDSIDGLKAHLPSNIVESLHRFRFIGNQAVHELQAPSDSELRGAIDVMEDLLNFLYELDYKVQIWSEGGLADPSMVRPSLQIIRRIIERQPPIPRGQRELYRALYAAGSHGLEITQLAKEMGRTKSQLYGALGALGRRINRTPGVKGEPGVGYVLELVRFEEGAGWGWKMRPELREALRSGNYKWAIDFAK
jgi:hypothetical protein